MLDGFKGKILTAVFPQWHFFLLFLKRFYKQKTNLGEKKEKF